MPDSAVKVGLTFCRDYEKASIFRKVFEIMEAGDIKIAPGARILVKPNLLLPKPLACSHPLVVAAVCQWLLDNGAKVEVRDSPGFGNAAAVAKAIGLTEALQPLNLRVLPMDRPVKKTPVLPDGKSFSVSISVRAMDSDGIFSVCKIKAHSQMRLTLAVKNCFGCIPGLRKAIFHTRMGVTTANFANAIAAVWNCLPPVTGVADGVTAMHVTGPSAGKPFELGLLGASQSSPALDCAIIATLGARPEQIPLRMVKNIAYPDLEQISWPLLKPEDFDAKGFILPENLAPASFNPLRLAKSLIRRIARNLARR